MESFEGFLPVLFGINSTGKVKDCYLCLVIALLPTTILFLSCKALKMFTEIMFEFHQRTLGLCTMHFFYCDYEQMQAAFDYGLCLFCDVTQIKGIVLL